MSVPTDYTNLSPQTLSDVMGMLEEIEGFVGLFQGAVPGALYLDSQNHATIGYGFLLDGGSTNSLGAVLDSITFTGTVTLQNGKEVIYNNNNVFQAVGIIAQAEGQSAPGVTVTQILDYFNFLINTYEGTSNPPAMLEKYLNNALQDFFAGYLPNNDPTGSPPSTPPPNNPFGVSSPPRLFMNEQEAAVALVNLIQGTTINEGLAGTLTIQGKSPYLYGVLTRGHVAPGTDGDLPVLSPSSKQWEALLVAIYNGGLFGTQTALAKGDSAQAWYDMRYAINTPLARQAKAIAAGKKSDAAGFAKRDYEMSQLFGLNGGQSGNTYATALQDYEMLTEHRSVIMQYEATFGADPNGSSPLAVSRTSALGYAVSEVQRSMGAKFPYTSGSQAITLTSSGTSTTVTVNPDIPGAADSQADYLADPDLGIDMTLAGTFEQVDPST